MIFRKIGQEEIVQRNYEYLLIAQDNGFFQDGYDKNNISTCTDWIVAWWIDELGNKKSDKNKFVNEYLPAFKRWFTNGVKSQSVVNFFDELILAEKSGILIDNDSFECISNLLSKFSPSCESLYKGFPNVSNHFNIKAIIDNLIRFRNFGIPINKTLSNAYGSLLAVESKGEPVNLDTFTFFVTCGYQSFEQDMILYDIKKRIEHFYGYRTCNGDEVKRLNEWLQNGSYNIDYVNELEKTIERLQQTIQQSGTLEDSLEIIKEKKLKNVRVCYYDFSNPQCESFLEVNGNLMSCDANSITIYSSNSFKRENITIVDNDNTIITSVEYGGIPLYINKATSERMMVSSLRKQIAYLKSQNVLDSYLNKFGTIEGLAYLRNHGAEFTSVVDRNLYPIDNLFTLCFESVADISRKYDFNKDVLPYVMYVYNGIMQGRFDGIDYVNYGYSVNMFISEENRRVIERICHYVVSAQLKESLPTHQMRPEYGQYGWDNVVQFPSFDSSIPGGKRGK